MKERITTSLFRWRAVCIIVACIILYFYTVLYTNRQDNWILEQKSRQAAVQQVCQDHGEDLQHKRVPLYDPRQRTSYLLYIPQLHLLFCIIPKAGSTTWIRGTLMKEIERLGLPQFDKRRQFMRYFKIKDTETLQKILDTNPLSFNNVRHPFERIASAYLDPDSKALAHIKEKSFEKFLTKYVLQPANASLDKKTFSQMNSHFRPYNSLCAFCNINYTILSRSETFEQDRVRIMGAMGLEMTNTKERLNNHGGSSAHNLTAKLFSTVSKKIKVELLDLYKYDFQMFNYDKNLY